LIQNLIFFKTHKNLCTRPLFITDLEYGYRDQEIQRFHLFLPQTGVFG
jgi:hypothetical protein